MNKRYPRYPDDADYQTNAPSYYDDLARKQKLIKMLAEKIWEYDEELAKRFEAWDKNLEEFPDEVVSLLEEWMTDGTLDHIINDTIFSWKADKSFVESEILTLSKKDEEILTLLEKSNEELQKQDEEILTLLEKSNEELQKQDEHLKNELVNIKTNKNSPFHFEDSGDYLFEPSASTLDQAGFASVIRMDDKIENPLDNFYMYWSGHDGRGIRLSTAPHPLGPWKHYPDSTTPLLNDTYFTPDVGHISSPHIVYDEVNEKFVLFYHHYLNGVQPTLRAESVDGINFNNSYEILTCPDDGGWDGKERSYFRCIIVNGIWHGVYQGRNGSADEHVHTGYATSKDGKKWNRLSHPLWYDNQFSGIEDTFNMKGGMGGSPNLFYYKEQLWNFYANKPYREIYVAPILDLNERETNPLKVMNNPSWALSGGVESPSFIVYEGIIYMYFNDYHLDGRRRIGVAMMKGDF